MRRWLIVLFAVVVAGCSSSTTKSSVPSAPTVTVTSGELVRGTMVTLRFDHLQKTRGQQVEVLVRTPAPVHTVSGGDRMGYGDVGSASVDSRGSAVLSLVVPNALSGEDDVIPLVPGDEYIVELRPRGAAASDELRLRVLAARTGVAYAISAGRGAAECGAPPLELDFDGRLWVPDQVDHFPATTKAFPGHFTLLTNDSGRFVASDGTTTTFTPAATGYSC